MRELFPFIPMIALLIWAAAVDLRTRRIPNWLTASLMLTGLAQSALAGWAILPAAGGMGVGFGLTFILFALGALCGGDVKLFTGIGAWVGPLRTLEVFAAAAVVGMVIVLVQAIQARRVATLMRNSAVIVMNAANGDLSCPPESPEPTAAHKHLPYAVPTLIGTLAVLLCGRRWL